MISRRVLVVLCSALFLVNSIGTVSFANNANVEKQRQQLQQKINTLSRLERKETNKLSRNQQKLEKNQRALQHSKNIYEKKQTNISNLQQELNGYIKEYNNRNKASAERIRCIYKNQHSLILDLLLSTSSISELLDRIYYQNLIIQSDKKKIKTLRTEAREIASVKKRLELEKRQLSGLIRTMDKENKAIEKTIKQNKNMIEKIQKDRRAYERSERELRRLSDNLTTIISKTSDTTIVTSSGGFLMPVQGARMSSPYGYRIHPIFKTKNFHSGIDYAAPYGTPIKAANSGKVIYSGWYGGYGKVVIIDHGNYNGKPTTSLYAHMSRQSVSVGTNVSRGQIVGYIGTTGYATGPHLHFEIRINGKHTNPRNYL